MGFLLCLFMASLINLLPEFDEVLVRYCPFCFPDVAVASSCQPRSPVYLTASKEITYERQAFLISSIYTKSCTYS